MPAHSLADASCWYTANRVQVIVQTQVALVGVDSFFIDVDPFCIDVDPFCIDVRQKSIDVRQKSIDRDRNCCDGDQKWVSVAAKLGDRDDNGSELSPSRINGDAMGISNQGLRLDVAALRRNHIAVRIAFSRRAAL